MRTNAPLIASLFAALTSAESARNATNATLSNSWSAAQETQYLAQLSSEVQSLRAQLQTQSLACAQSSGPSDSASASTSHFGIDHAVSATSATSSRSSVSSPVVSSNPSSAGNAAGGNVSPESSSEVTFGSLHQSSTISSISLSLSAQSSGQSLGGVAATPSPVSATVSASASQVPYPYNDSSNSSVATNASSSSNTSTIASSTKTATANVTFTGIPVLSDFTNAQIQSGDAWNNVSSLALERMQQDINNRTNQACSFDNARVRTEFRSMSNADRKSLTDAFTCLQNKAPQVMTESESGSYPGVKSRYDEFVATHINMTYRK